MKKINFLFYCEVFSRHRLTFIGNKILPNDLNNRNKNIRKLCSFPPRHYRKKEELKENNTKQLLDDAATFENEHLVNNIWSTSPYPKGGFDYRKQYRHALRPRVDPRDTSLILFPGEGSQFVGMGENLLQFPGVKDIFRTANEVLRYDLLSLCLKGPKAKLDQIQYAQVAVMVCSFAALEKFKEERPGSVENCMATAGFGVGEITALAFAGVLPFERAVRLTQLRGETMQIASESEPSGMLTVLYSHRTKLHEVFTKAKEYAASQGVSKPVCDVAHYLFPHCKVIAGHNQCLDYIAKNYQQLELEKIRRLNIQGAYHTRMMQPAMITFRKYLQRSTLHDPVIAVHSTVDCKVYQDKEDVYNKLPKQIVRPVRWEQLMHTLYERPVGTHFPSTFEVGPGNSLKTILKMVNAKAYDSCYSVFDLPNV